MSETKLYSKVLIKVPSEFIHTMKDGSLLITNKTRKSYTRKPKEETTTIINNESVDIVQEPTKPKRKSKFSKGSPDAIEFMNKLRALRKKK